MGFDYPVGCRIWPVPPRCQCGGIPEVGKRHVVMWAEWAAEGEGTVAEKMRSTASRLLCGAA